MITIRMKSSVIAFLLATRGGPVAGQTCPAPPALFFTGGFGRIVPVSGSGPTSYIETGLGGGFVEMIEGAQTATACYDACNSPEVAALSAFPINSFNDGDLVGVSWNGGSPSSCICYSHDDATGPPTYSSECITGNCPAYGCTTTSDPIIANTAPTGPTGPGPTGPGPSPPSGPSGPGGPSSGPPGPTTPTNPPPTPPPVPPVTPPPVPPVTPPPVPPVTPPPVPPVTPPPVPTPTPPPTTARPTDSPTKQPTPDPTPFPTDSPTESPTASQAPSSQPSLMPSAVPSTSAMPSSMPSEMPSTSAMPSAMPSSQPSSLPSSVPSSQPSFQPSVSTVPSTSTAPSSQPSLQPSVSSEPSTSSAPSSQPSSQPSGIPSGTPTGRPSYEFPGCADRYRDGSTYATGNFVSTAPDAMNQAFNYECVEGPNSGYCGRAGYGPEETGGSEAWIKRGRCSLANPYPLQGSAPDPWSGVGCPAEFSSSEEYGAGEVVSVCSNDRAWCEVYRCKTDSPHPSRWCSVAGYEPGTGVAWGEAWISEGSCTGTMSPASAPTTTMADPGAWSGGGCPAPFDEDAEYSSGEAVSICPETGDFCLVYTCNMDAPRTSLWCSMVGYEPGLTLSVAAQQAWTLQGSCRGTMSPSSASLLSEFGTYDGGCPSEFDQGVVYHEGDKVSVNGIAFECKSWPDDARCSQSGFAPLDDSGTPDAWKLAWNALGTCSGSIAPTTAPNFVSLADVGGCPLEWQAGSYEGGDQVSKDGIVFECKAWPMGAHCGQIGYEPLVDFATPDAWKYAWTAVGHCSGTIAPTGSPVFVSKSVGVPPPAWSPGTTYEEGDLVKVVVSDSPLREVVYRCKPWPYTPFCSQHAPDAHGGELGWEYVGHTSATPKTISFDDVSTAPVQPIASYEGLRWSNTGAVKSGLWTSGGLATGVVSQSYGAVCADYSNTFAGCDNLDQVFNDPPLFNPLAPCAISSGTAFSAVGFKATALVRDGVTVLVEGFDSNGDLVGSHTATVSTSGPTSISLPQGDFGYIYKLKITSSGGTVATTPWTGFSGNSGAYIIIDDVEVIV